MVRRDSKRGEGMIRILLQNPIASRVDEDAIDTVDESVGKIEVVYYGEYAELGPEPKQPETSQAPLLPAQVIPAQPVSKKAGAKRAKKKLSARSSVPPAGKKSKSKQKKAAAKRG